MIWGDPHFSTFDGLTHHYQGKCSYQYVTSCNVDVKEVPFQIIGSHVPCFSKDMTCIDKLYVKLFDNHGEMAADIVLHSDQTGIYTHKTHYIYVHIILAQIYNIYSSNIW